MSTVPGCKAMTQQRCRSISRAVVRVAWFCAAFVMRYEYLGGQRSRGKALDQLSRPTATTSCKMMGSSSAKPKASAAPATEIVVLDGADTSRNIDHSSGRAFVLFYSQLWCQGLDKQQRTCCVHCKRSLQPLCRHLRRSTTNCERLHSELRRRGVRNGRPAHQAQRFLWHVPCGTVVQHPSSIDQ